MTYAQIVIQRLFRRISRISYRCHVLSHIWRSICKYLRVYRMWSFENDEFSPLSPALDVGNEDDQPRCDMQKKHYWHNILPLPPYLYLFRYSRDTNFCRMVYTSGNKSIMIIDMASIPVVTMPQFYGGKLGTLERMWRVLMCGDKGRRRGWKRWGIKI